MASQHLLNGIYQVLEQVPTVSDLNCIRGTLCGTVGIGDGAVPGNDLHPRMVSQPGS